MVLNELQRVSYKVFGGAVKNGLSLDKLDRDLRKARLGVRAEAYMATAIAFSILSALVGLALSALLFLIILPVAMPAGVPKALYVLFPVVPMMLAAGTYATMLANPASRAKARAKDIDMRIPYALNYISAMASAGVNIDQVFRSLGEQQKVYGECAREAQAIYRDMAYFGRDSVTAMKRAIDRSPSDKWQEFLQGAITTVTSGGNLQLYFASKAERFMWENRQSQKQFVDLMGLMAETYVTAVVAGPLFLIVMMSIMGMLGGGGPGTLYLIVYMLLPIANFGFAFALSAMTPEV
ncbi:MAG TPA: type II secretion system F family protein [Candidatus Thermoplasmatota archaeon]|nr:type II secretion system F family protein [Candidatus Thermoplasmatota archaeon]